MGGIKSSWIHSVGVRATRQHAIEVQKAAVGRPDRDFRLALVHLKCRLQTLAGGMISPLFISLGTEQVQMVKFQAVLQKGIVVFQPALIFSFSLSVCVLGYAFCCSRDQ